MDWSSVTFDWNRARAFLVTAEEGSFSAAGRALGLAQPTVGRQVAALEEELGITLFERVGGGLELTQAGLGLVEHVRVMGQAATRVSLAATGQSQALEGLVRITASETAAAFWLPPLLEGLREEHPAIQLELVASDEARDLARREADIAVRSFRPRQPDLVGRKICDDAAFLFAHVSYLERIGGLHSPQDMARATIMSWDRTDLMVEYLVGLGLPVTTANFSIISSSHLVQWSLAQHGLGLCVMSESVGRTTPGMVRILPDLPPMQIETWLVTHREVRTSRRIRVVFDHLAEGLTARLGG